MVTSWPWLLSDLPSVSTGRPGGGAGEMASGEDCELTQRFGERQTLFSGAGQLF